MAEVCVRPCRADEVESVLVLWREAEAVPSATDSAPAIARLLHQDPGALLVAEEDGTLAGVLIAGWDGWRGNLYRLAVAPGRRREGVARALVAEGERRLRELGAVRITALVVEDEAARAFWTAAGYERDPHIARFVKTLPPP